MMRQTAQFTHSIGVNIDSVYDLEKFYFELADMLFNADASLDKNTLKKSSACEQVAHTLSDLDETLDSLNKGYPTEEERENMNAYEHEQIVLHIEREKIRAYNETVSLFEKWVTLKSISTVKRAIYRQAVRNLRKVQIV